MQEVDGLLLFYFGYDFSVWSGLLFVRPLGRPSGGRMRRMALPGQVKSEV